MRTTIFLHHRSVSILLLANRSLIRAFVPEKVSVMFLPIFAVVWVFATEAAPTEKTMTNISDWNSLFTVIPEGSPPAPQERIVGGYDAKIYQYGFVGVLKRAFEYYCTAVLITDEFVLTAAHCVDRKLTWYKVILGAQNLKAEEEHRIEVGVDEVFLYPHYKYDDGISGDIAVLKLKERVKFNKYIFPAQLPNRDVYASMPLLVLGWGKKQGGLKFHSLQAAHTYVTRYDLCRHIYKWLDRNMFCVANGRTSTCTGDAGGPAIYEKMVMGIASFGSEDCQKSFPQGYANVFKGKVWIEEIIGKHKSGSSCPSPQVFVVLSLALVPILLRQ
ncbi:factor V activator RVV-V alpha-like [Penaeus monodon]|uniref:factor V activator RVV-V alpha-like n=1 Tax=Penaeus monodon TaxID=6687 RepID=UPI0018A7C1F4|nr:factor V activator RVV-V alpha-like [Penaeus monodon]